MTAGRILVVGAKIGSLGEAVAQRGARRGFEVMVAGISGESVPLDCFLNPMEYLESVFASVMPRYVLCTAGINMPLPDSAADLSDWYRWHWEANVVGPMRLLAAFAAVSQRPDYLPGTALLHYAAISSNSARIPRSSSGAYCASKAGLSMALRVAAREAHGGDLGYLVYGYEPGLLAGTPMTKRTEEQWGVGAHRMRGSLLDKGIDTDELAEVIINNFVSGGPALNGSLIPYDGGEV